MHAMLIHCAEDTISIVRVVHCRPHARFRSSGDGEVNFYVRMAPTVGESHFFRLGYES